MHVLCFVLHSGEISKSMNWFPFKKICVFNATNEYLVKKKKDKSSKADMKT